ncbi:hypothetical protein F5Y08DRAFT_344507 [Xylaria arbuscula]|uniref:Something about silencing protein 4 domain-containing protein n=1 Tax=Xylaria arbuscula TaxID=114810 RepID=A0A9W8TNG8_9PEZI|nr:hypothetical protein F5Y08DRAFT_344507 [Xylaria arbuscula]KAJ3572283.1 hypothetical protein NPX13_g5098 [Xylaria arbuscula]
MDLTEENVSKLPSDGSFFSSYYTPSRPTTPSVDVPEAVRLKKAKEFVEVNMLGFHRLGKEGHRILREDELYIAGDHDIRFRDSEKHKQNIDNLDYWVAKAKDMGERYDALYAEKHPVEPFIEDPNDPAVIEQNKIDRMHFRAERRKRRTQAWVSEINHQRQEYPRIIDSSISRYIEPSSRTTTTTDNRPSFIPRPSSRSEDSADLPIPLVEAPKIRAPKRKRSNLEDEQENDGPSSKRSVQAHLSRETLSTTIEEPPREHPTAPFNRKRTTRKTALATSPSNPTPLRRSARIAALPKIKYPK